MGLRTKHSGDHALIILRWRYGLSTNHRFGHLLQPGFFYANLQSSPVRKWKTVLSFSKARRAVFCAGLDARALIQGLGLTVVDQGHPRAALDVNDLWIPILVRRVAQVSGSSFPFSLFADHQPTRVPRVSRCSRPGRG